jgi:hypothetical protein
MQALPESAADAEKAQQEPHPRWSSTAALWKQELWVSRTS